MKALFIAFALISFSHASLAEKLIYPAFKKQSWDKMEEKAFSKEAAIEQLKILNKLFSGEIEVAEEFIHQSNLILEGASYRMEVDIWKKDSKNYKYAKERFCKFMAERAYLVH
ncbi:MAG: hypothetical protein ACRBBR_16885 [Cellvibrionaceae bacterium]